MDAQGQALHGRQDPRRDPAAKRRALTEDGGGTRGPTCCIAGCGPAGAVLGLLLARAGVEVLVLEKHGDFLRDFRGDTIHPSTLDILDDLGLADRFLSLPHSRAATLTLRTTAGNVLQIDFGGLHARYPFIAFVPQWDFLTFITNEARRYPGFQLRMSAEVTDLIREGGVVRGVRYRAASGEADQRALLTVGADGRSSRTREAAGLPQVATSPPMDVLWFRVSRRTRDEGNIQAVIGPGHFIVFFDRGEYWQVGYVIPKGGADAVHAAGLEALRRSVAALVPAFADRVGELRDWDQVKLLTVHADRLTRWYRPGYLAIGDAAHAMSPVAGVGINVAIQDATAAANVLWGPLRRSSVSTADLAEVQRRRQFPVRVVQAMQTFMQRQILERALSPSGRQPGIPPILRAVLEAPGMRAILPSLVAFGVFRPRVESPALAAVSDGE